MSANTALTAFSMAVSVLLDPPIGRHDDRGADAREVGVEAVGVETIDVDGVSEDIVQRRSGTGFASNDARGRVRARTAGGSRPPSPHRPRRRCLRWRPFRRCPGSRSRRQLPGIPWSSSRRYQESRIRRFPRGCRSNCSHPLRPRAPCTRSPRPGRRKPRALFPRGGTRTASSSCSPRIEQPVLREHTGASTAGGPRARPLDASSALNCSLGVNFVKKCGSAGGVAVPGRESSPCPSRRRAQPQAMPRANDLLHRVGDDEGAEVLIRGVAAEADDRTHGT